MPQTLNRLAFTGFAISLALSGCATKSSVKLAQSTADQAMTRAQDGSAAAQRAQTSADAAGTAAQRAQTTADGAGTAAQGASTDAKSAHEQIGRLDAKMKRLETRVARLARHTHRRHKHHWHPKHQHHQVLKSS